MKVNNEHMSIEKDELGLKDFTYSFYQDFYGCLDEFINSADNITIEQLSDIVGFDRIEKKVRTKCLLEFIYNSTKDRTVKEFIDAYWYKLCFTSNQNIKEFLNDEIHDHFSFKLKSKFSSDMKPYIAFSNEIVRGYNKLRSDKEDYDKKTSERYSELKKSFIGDLDDIDDYIDNDSDYCKYMNNMLELDERVESLKIYVSDMREELNSYLSLDEEYVEMCFNKLVSSKVNEFFNSKCVVKKFNKSDLIRLIKQIRKFAGEIPGTVSIVVSEIERIAQQHGLKSHSNDKISEVQVPVVDNDDSDAFMKKIGKL